MGAPVSGAKMLRTAALNGMPWFSSLGNLTFFDLLGNLFQAGPDPTEWKAFLLPGQVQPSQAGCPALSPSFPASISAWHTTVLTEPTELRLSVLWEPLLILPPLGFGWPLFRWFTLATTWKSKSWYHEDGHRVPMHQAQVSGICRAILSNWGRSWNKMCTDSAGSSCITWSFEL